MSALERIPVQDASYSSELRRAMTMLARDERTLFVGQGVLYDGQRMHASFADVPKDRRIEFPVAEDTQLGFCTGLAMSGYVPVSVFPRIDFLVLAMNQLVNHLDKIPQMSAWRPKVIIRTAIGARKPFSAGPQHTQDHTVALRSMLKKIPLLYVDRAEDALRIYESALHCSGSVVVVEYMEKYDSN